MIVFGNMQDQNQGHTDTETAHKVLCTTTTNLYLLSLYQ